MLRSKRTRHCGGRGGRAMMLVLGFTTMLPTAIVNNVGAQAVPPTVPGQVNPVQPISVPPSGAVSAPPPSTTPPSPTPGAVPPNGAPVGVAPGAPTMPTTDAVYTYNPSGRRDPCAAIVLEGPKAGAENL